MGLFSPVRNRRVVATRPPHALTTVGVTLLDTVEGHGWYFGGSEPWGLMPGDQGSWGDRWQAHCAARGVDVDSLAFETEAHRSQFVRDVGQ